MNEIKNHLYNVHLATGMVRLTESQIGAQFGYSAFERYADRIDHSEWCECRDKAIASDPFLAAGPPF